MLYQTTVHRDTHHFEGIDLVTDNKNSTFIYLFVDNIVSDLSLVVRLHPSVAHYSPQWGVTAL